VNLGRPKQLLKEQRSRQPELLPTYSGSSEEGTGVCGDDWAFLRLKACQCPTGKSVRKIRTIDLFCGCGGLSLGIREGCRSIGLAFEAALAVDLDESAADCYRRNFPGSCVKSGDVDQILAGCLGEPLTKDEARSAISLGAIDLLVGGPPCQGHSDLNNFSRRSDPKNNLYLLMGRAAEVWRPRHVIVENVAGVVRSRQRVVERVAGHLSRLGYFVDHAIVDLWRIGVPQSRRRHVLLASLERRLKVNEVACKYQTTCRDLRWAIGDLEDAPSKGLLDQPANTSKDNRRRIDFLFDCDRYDLPDEQRPPCHAEKQHSYKSIYGRLRWDQPAQTVTTGFYSMPMGRYVHPSRRRTLTAHEAARLQFFPDFFDFSNVENRSSLARLIGNAVPMKLSYVLSRELLSLPPETTVLRSVEEKGESR
jgi:DNA (cytosine-5)-methyltransferase 1